MVNESIDSGKEFDWGRASEDYARYRDIYPHKFYEKLLSKGLCRENQRILDIGTGTGVLPRNLSKFGGEFTGVDISENQIKYAKLLTEKAGLDIDYYVCSAERLPFEDKSFDAVTACQCFYYFDEKRLFPEIHRILKKDGHFLILFMEWLYYESDIVRKSVEIINKYNPLWSGSEHKDTVYPIPPSANGLFKVLSNETFPVDITFTREKWNGRMKCCRGVGAEMPPETVERWEREHLQYLSSLPESFSIPHHIVVADLLKI